MKNNHAKQKSRWRYERKVSQTLASSDELGTIEPAKFSRIIAKSYSRDGHPCGDRVTVE